MYSKLKINELPAVAVIVLNWNQRDLTIACLYSVFEMNYPDEKIRLILVDNGSTDGTIEAVKNQFPNSHIVKNSDNLGFAEGNNRGIQLAMNLDVDYVMLLNNDTVVHEEMMLRLIKSGYIEDRIGIVIPKVYEHDLPQRIWSAGSVVDWRNGQTSRLLAGQDDTGLDGSIAEIDFGSGCALCVRKEVIEDVGLMDSRYFLYYEEADWCLRAKNRGWKIRYVPRAKVWHRISRTIGSNSAAIDYYMQRNVILFLMKNHPSRFGKWLSVARAIARNLLTVTAYTLNTREGKRKKNRNARLLALRDGLRQHWGQMPSDVANVCE